MNQTMNRWVDDGAPPAATRFTDKQGQYLAFIWAYRQINGQAPAERDMERHFRVTPPTVHQMILTLERAGLVRRKPGVPRSLQMLVNPATLPVLLAQPVKSSVQRY